MSSNRWLLPASALIVLAGAAFAFTGMPSPSSPPPSVETSNDGVPGPDIDELTGLLPASGTGPAGWTATDVAPAGSGFCPTANSGLDRSSATVSIGWQDQPGEAATTFVGTTISGFGPDVAGTVVDTIAATLTACGTSWVEADGTQVAVVDVTRPELGSSAVAVRFAYQDPAMSGPVSIDVAWVAGAVTDGTVVVTVAQVTAGELSDPVAAARFDDVARASLVAAGIIGG